MDCIFCKIAKGKIPSFKVYESNNVLSFLDINPLTKGHCLVIPKEHFENIFYIDKNILEEVISVGKIVSEKINKNLNSDGIRLSQSNGKVAGQEVMHFHLHIIPRYKDDGIDNSMTATSHRPQADFGELKNLAEKISKNI